MAEPDHTPIGAGFSFLTVVSPAFKGVNKRWYVRCSCACGRETEVMCKNLLAGGTKSCGCYGRQLDRVRRVTHGKSRTPTWWSYRAMLTRCTNPRQSNWRNYGGRGVRVCQRWLEGFENFLADMGERPAGRTLDRIDTDGNYEPSNCRWATNAEQRANKRCG